VNVDHSRLDEVRAGHGEIANHVIDEYVAGHMSRRDLIRRGTVIGISMPAIGAIIAACGSSKPSSGGGGGGTSGGANATIRAGINAPSGEINPLTVDDQGGLDMLAQGGEYLTLSTQTLSLKPVLAKKWSANSTADVWTFNLQEGVKFHNGQPMTADDVVYTYQLMTDPKKGSNALSAFGGGLLPDGVKKVDDHTVEFHLTAPDGNFPYLTSSDNYNMIIIPNNYDPSKWQSTFLGTGPFLLKSFTPKQGASFVRNKHYWSTPAKPAATQFTFYETETPMTLALTGGSIDVVGQFSVAGSPQLLNGQYTVSKLKSSAHRELSMRTDLSPFTDPRVRRAIALTLDRPAIVKSLFNGYADLGNDSPFAPVFPSTDTSIPQRAKNISQAKSLMSAAGHSSGFSTQLLALDQYEIPQYAQIVQAAAKAIGVHINVKTESSSVYYGKATFGNSDWLDGTMSMVDYGHRSVPNVFLSAPLETINAKKGTGSWNAARFNNSQYDKLVGQYIAEVDLSAQRRIAGQIETLLLTETPIIYGYFYNYLSAWTKSVSGVYPTAIGHLFLNNATKM
jgi:peptide/nickel transport system substrate-binding protein